jgi:tRNA-binding protein
MSGIEKGEVGFGEFQKLDLRVARVISAEPAEAARFPSRVLELDLGPLGTRTSVGQFALVEEGRLTGAKVIACVNLGSRKMGPYTSQALVLGTPHPESPTDQAQAVPLWADPVAGPGDIIY